MVISVPISIHHPVPSSPFGRVSRLGWRWSRFRRLDHRSDIMLLQHLCKRARINSQIFQAFKHGCSCRWLRCRGWTRCRGIYLCEQLGDRHRLFRERVYVLSCQHHLCLRIVDSRRRDFRRPWRDRSRLIMRKQRCLFSFRLRVRFFALLASLRQLNVR